MRQSRTSPVVAIFLGATLVLLALAGAMGLAIQAVDAQQPIQDPDGVIVGIDMDTTDNSCPQGVAGVGANCTLGTLDAPTDRCASVAAGAQVVFDVFLEDLDTDSHLGQAYDLSGWPASGVDGTAPQITSVISTGAPAMITSRAGAIPINFSEAVPDGDNPFTVAAADIGTAEYNPPYTHGVLERYTLDTTGAAPGVYGMTISNLAVGRDTAADAAYPFYALGGDLTIQALWDANFSPQYGLIAVDTACPSAVQNADVAITGQTIQAANCIDPAPASINAGVDTQLCLHKTIVNSGPTTPVDVSITAGAAGAADCTITPDPGNPTSFTGLTSTPATVDERFTVNCSQPSLHTFTFNNDIAVTTANVTDPDTGNNSASTPLSMNVVAQADVAIANQALVTPPTQINTNTDTQLTLRKTLHNNGAFGPVSVSIAPTATPPASCTATASPTNPTSANLPVSTDVTVDEVWTINCSQPSTHAFSFGDTIAITTAHVTDPNTANNTASTPFSVDVLASADAKITGQSLVSPPTEITQGQDTQVTLRKTLHDNGPFGPVGVSITNSADATGAPGCTATPSGTNPTSANLPVSTDVLVDEVWTLNCSTTGAKPFTFNNAIAVTTAHVTDPTPANNSASTPLNVTVVPPAVTADVKIVSQSFVTTPPTQINVSQDLPVTVRKTLHNNGPSGPVDVSITATASVPAGCTATAAPANPTSASLPVSTDVTVDETWTLHCTEPSTHSFTFNDSISPTTPGATDPNPANNSASTPLSVDVIASADVKITSQAFVTPPTQINASANTDVTLRKTLHNNGPFGPVDVSIAASATPPAGCTATPSAANPTSANLPVSSDVVVDEVWTINCTQPSTHNFSFSDAIAVTTPHVTDPTPANDSASTPLTVDVIASADAKITGQSLVSPPAEITQGQDTQVTLRKTLHDNGPFGPVDVSITNSVDATGAPGCTATPSGTNPTAATLPTSVAQTVDEVWTLNCTTTGPKAFFFENAIGVTTVHVTDPDTANNSASTPLNVNVVPPAATADVKITAQSLVTPPTEMNASQNTDVTLRKTLHNNGPSGPVDVSITTQVTAPADCTATPAATNPTSATLEASVAQTVDEVWTLHCTNPSAHSFTFNNSIALSTPGATDPNPANNSASTPLNINVIASADAKITGQSLVSMPAELTQGQDTQVTLRKTLHDNGPFGPVDVSIVNGVNVTGAPGCTATPSGTNPTAATLPTSVAQTVDEVWTLNCSTTGPKAFFFENAIGVTTVHVTDPDTANNSASTPLNVNVVPPAAEADGKITSQTLVSPPATLNAGESTNVTLRKTLHNNGPSGPVDVSITTDLSAPADCTGGVTVPAATSLPVSSDVVVDEVWSINCSQPSTHAFTFNNSIAITTPGISDPNPANNSATTPFSANVVASADVKIVSQAFVSPPTQMDASASTDVTLRKTLHNNGGYGPVNVSISANAVAPAGCTATPSAANPATASLPVSTDVTVDEVWALHCAQPSTHVFSFSDAIAVTDPHVVDPTPANNSASTELSVDVIANADVKITAQSMFNPPAQITQGQNTPVTLRKTLHNNGPFGPVNVNITANATPPTGCTATPNAANPTATTLPVSTAVTVDEVWTVNCSETGAKSFTFDNAIAVATAHVADPNGANNSASTTLAVTVVPAATPTPTPTPPPVIEVRIDIKPGSFPNTINLSSKGVIPVALLGSATFDVRSVDYSTVVFAGAPVASGPAFMDVNRDGFLDAVMQFRTQQTNIQPGDTQACLTGNTLGGTPIHGCDSIRTLGG